MRAYRILGLLIASAAMVLTAPTAATAAPYPDAPPASSVSDGTVGANGAVEFCGEGFAPGEEISINVSYGESGSNLGQVTASEDGSFCTSVQLTELGSATLMAVGLSSGVTTTATVQVVAPGGDGGEDNDGGNGGSDDDGDDTSADGGSMLPTTGTSGRMMAFSVFGGLGAVMLGAGLLWFTRTRRRSTAS